MSKQLLIFAWFLWLAKCNVIVNTWPYPKATDAGWKILTTQNFKFSDVTNAMKAVEIACNQAEDDTSFTTVGYGGSPDENGDVRLDAMIINGNTLEVGAVASMPRVKHAISVALSVYNYSRHSLLVGDSAAAFAQMMGHHMVSTLTTPESKTRWINWRIQNCQPNFRKNVIPENRCGPYKPIFSNEEYKFGSDNRRKFVDTNNHDTIGVIALDKNMNMAVGTSTNGASFKIPGRVGDTAIVGAGGFVDSDIGGCVETGDGDFMMRYLLTYKGVSFMAAGYNPTLASQTAIRSVNTTTKWSGAIVCLNKRGEHGAAAIGFVNFQYCVRNEFTNSTKIITI